MDTKRALAAAVIVAAVVGAVAWYGREQNVQDCQRALVASYDANPAPALTAKAEDCFRRGLVGTLPASVSP